MLLKCSVEEDSWESLRLQGDPTSQSKGKSVLNIHCKDLCWSWSSNPLATWCENWLTEKDPDAGKDWRQEEKEMTEDEMVGCHHWFYGHKFEQAPGVGDGQRGLVCCSPWGGKELDTTEWLNWLIHSENTEGGPGVAWYVVGWQKLCPTYPNAHRMPSRRSMLF